MKIYSRLIWITNKDLKKIINKVKVLALVLRNAIRDRKNDLQHNWRNIEIWRRHGAETRFHFADNPNFTVGKHTYGIPFLRVYHHPYRVTIGAFCSIAEDCQLLIGGSHKISNVSSYPFNAYRRHFPSTPPELFTCNPDNYIEIGNDVWFGRHVIVLNGVTIGDGAVIGAGTVVSKDVPPYAVVVGNPMRIIKYRFDPETIDAIQGTEWWNLDDSDIDRLVPLMGNIPEFVAAYNDIKKNLQQS